MRNPRRYALIVFILSLLSLFLVLGMRESIRSERERRTAQLQPVQPSAVETETVDTLGTVSDFALDNARGGQTTLNGLRGHVWVADFMFTSCQGTCPALTENMRALQRSLAEAEDVRFVSISVDPETDTPERLADYAQEQDADVESWDFVTGDRDEIQEVMVQGFMVGSMDEPLFHSNRFVLVDRSGRIRGYYEGTDPEEIGRLRDDIQRLRSESAG